MPPKIKDHVLKISPYIAGSSGQGTGRTMVKLSSNECPFGASPKAIAAFRGVSDTLAIYPDAGAGALRTALGAHVGLPAEQIVCGNGSDELLALLALCFAGPGDEVVTTKPGFLIYEIATQSNGAAIRMVPLKNDRPDIDALLAAVSERTTLLYLANPGNPTGTYLTGPEVRRLHAGLPDHVLLVLDGAYADFPTDPDFSPGEDLVRVFDNVVTTRTFSKSYGLAGIRIGWAACPPEVAGALNRVRGPFNANIAAQAAAIAALKDTDFLKRYVDHVATWRETLSRACAALGIQVPDSGANFIMLRFASAKAADAANACLRADGYVVRPLGAYEMADCLRLTIGRDEDNEGVLASLRRASEDGLI